MKLLIDDLRDPQLLIEFSNGALDELNSAIWSLGRSIPFQMLWEKQKKPSKLPGVLNTKFFIVTKIWPTT